MKAEEANGSGPGTLRLGHPTGGERRGDGEGVGAGEGREGKRER